MAFVQDGQVLVEAAIARCRSDLNGVMTEVAAKADRWPFFRAFTFFGVLLAFPIALYCLLFAGLRLVFGLRVRGRDPWPDGLSALTCLLIGLGLLAFFHSSRPPPLTPDDIGPALESASWQTRAAGLREIRRRRLDVVAYPAYAALRNSPHPQERYWLARALATGSDPAASADLAVLLSDPDINVQTQAVEAIAQRRDRSAVPGILRRLKASPDWYFQSYAYRALRALGWNQAASR
jgi:hypothetical protein